LFITIHSFMTLKKYNCIFRRLIRYSIRPDGYPYIEFQELLLNGSPVIGKSISGPPQNNLNEKF